jgi:hypothetical protein
VRFHHLHEASRRAARSPLAYLEDRLNKKPHGDECEDPPKRRTGGESDSSAKGGGQEQRDVSTSGRRQSLRRGAPGPEPAAVSVGS